MSSDILKNTIKNNLENAFIRFSNLQCQGKNGDDKTVEKYNEFMRKILNEQLEKVNKVIEKNNEVYNTQKLYDLTNNIPSLLYQLNNVVLNKAKENNEKLFSHMCVYISHDNLYKLILNVNKLILSIIVSKMKLVLDNNNNDLNGRIIEKENKIKELETQLDAIKRVPVGNASQEDKDKLQSEKGQLEATIERLNKQLQELNDKNKRLNKLENEGISKLINIINSTQQIVDSNDKSDTTDYNTGFDNIISSTQVQQQPVGVIPQAPPLVQQQPVGVIPQAPPLVQQQPVGKIPQAPPLVQQQPVGKIPQAPPLVQQTSQGQPIQRVVGKQTSMLDELKNASPKNLKKASDRALPPRVANGKSALLDELKNASPKNLKKASDRALPPSVANGKSALLDELKNASPKNLKKASDRVLKRSPQQNGKLSESVNDRLTQALGRRGKSLNAEDEEWENKYLKYKNKYLQLKKLHNL
jgi:hypothetical protein